VLAQKRSQKNNMGGLRFRGIYVEFGHIFMHYMTLKKATGSFEGIALNPEIHKFVFF